MDEFAKMIYEQWNKEHDERDLFFDKGSELMDKLETILSRDLCEEIYDKFCKHYGLNPEEYTKSINDLRSIYKIKLNFFDEYPELEEPFEAMMGPNIINIDEDKITLDIVKQVLKGDISDQQAYEILKEDGEQSDDLAQSTPFNNALPGMNMF